MKRREFITLLGGGAAAWQLAAAGSSPKRLARIGYLVFTSASQHAPNSDAFRASLRGLGYIEGRNIRIE